jgi:hypothetical protein
LESRIGAIGTWEVHRAQLALAAGEDPRGRAGDMARDIAKFLAFIESRTYVDAPPPADV